MEISLCTSHSKSFNFFKIFLVGIDCQLKKNVISGSICKKRSVQSLLHSNYKINGNHCYFMIATID